jgi:protein-disulfide isomerase
VHPQVAVLPGLAACAADKQGKFMAMHGLLFEKGFAEQALGEDKINALAKEAGLDMARFQKDLEGDECITLLKDSHATLGKLGVTGTPTFFINGRHLVGAQPITEFKKLIDEELAKANAAIARGTRVEDYYRKAVLEAGKPSL